MAETQPVINSVNQLKDAFLKVNRMRLARTEEYLSTEQAHFLELLPLLFHINHPELPGYVSEGTPAGISQYSPGYSAHQAMKSLFPTLRLERRASHQMDIYSLFCMGSSGTIAYTRKSDFDIWVVHAPGLSAQKVNEIAQKARAIENWAICLRLEVHFFIMDPEEFRKGKHDSLSSESSGSAQHYLLLDEFYRSSLLLAGRYPVWWLVPPEEEQNYAACIDELITSRQLDTHDVVDLGGLADIPADEFFGAAVWQLYKGISAPFKSVLKLLLMEVYASEYPHIELLSQWFKRAVYEGKRNFTDIDPYLIMYRKVENYLCTRMDSERLDLFRKSFYFKINIRLSQKRKRATTDWRREHMMEMVRDWGWDDNKLRLLDSRDSWRISNVITERRLLIDTFTTCYQFLSRFARQHTEVSRLSQTELNMLGRKLYAAFERKSGKVDIINRGIAPSIIEQELSFYHVQKKDTPDSWLLYQGKFEIEKSIGRKPLKRAASIIELLVWCHFNRIIGPSSALSLQSPDQSTTVRELRDIQESLEKLFPGSRVPKTSFQDLSKPARINTACLFVNTGIKSTPSANSGDSYLSSSRSDALSFGALHENLARSFDLVITTSWEETLIFRYQGVDGLFQCISEYMHWAPLEQRIAPPAVNVFSFSSTYSRNIVNRIEELFSSVLNTYYSFSAAERLRYVLMIEDHYYVCEYKNEALHYHKATGLNRLVAELGRASDQYSPVVFDRYTNWKTPLAEIYRLNREGIIQMFYLVEEKAVTIYIIDERGALFIQHQPFHDSQSLINHFMLFFGSTIRHRNILYMESEQAEEDFAMEFHQLKKAGDSYSVTNIDIVPGMNKRNFFNIQVMGSLEDDNKTTLTIFCEDQEFSSLEYGNNLFRAVASHVLKGRASGQTYPIYITDIDLSRSLLYDPEIDSLQTIHFMKYKKRIEDKLNAAMAEL